MLKLELNKSKKIIGDHSSEIFQRKFSALNTSSSFFTTQI